MTHSGVATGIRLTSDCGDRTGSVNKFIFHHAAGTSLAVLMNLFQPGGRTVSANYGIKDAQCILAVDEDKRAKTSGSIAFDGRAITVEVCNETGAPSWGISDASFHTLARLIADCSSRYGFPINNDTVLGHRELKERFGVGYATGCPMVLYARKAELLNLARHYQGQGPAPAPGNAPAPAPAGTNWATVQIAVDGDFGPQTKKKLQYALGFRGGDIDGYFGPVSKRRLQAKLGQVQDGNIGPVTVRALQRHLGCYVDGNWGPQTTTFLQRRLNAGTF